MTNYILTDVARSVVRVAMECRYPAVCINCTPQITVAAITVKVLRQLSYQVLVHGDNSALFFITKGSKMFPSNIISPAFESIIVLSQVMLSLNRYI